MMRFLNAVLDAMTDHGQLESPGTHDCEREGRDVAEYSAYLASQYNHRVVVWG